MGKKNKGTKGGLPKTPPDGMDERNAVYVGRRVAVRGLRSPIMVVTGTRGNMVRTTWFDEQLQQAEGTFHPLILVIVPEEHEKDQPDEPVEPAGEDPLETLKKATQDAADAAQG